MKIPHVAALALSWWSALFLTTHSSAQAPAPAGVKTLRDLAYVDGGTERQRLDLYLPEKTAAPLPLIIWIHGGGWAAGDKAGCPAQRMTAQGYAVASLNYRLSGDAIFPAQIEDCKAAIRWLRAHAKEYNLDANHFGVWGSSAGGHLVALLGTSGDVRDFDKGAHLDLSSRVQAVCDYYGPTDLLQMDAHALPAARLKHDPATSPESRLIGGAIQENKEKTARANPIAYITPDDPPFLIVHGDQDPTVPHHQSELLFDALKKAGVSVHFHTIHGAGHGNGFAGKNIDDMVNAFFDQNLKTASTTRSAPEALTTESTVSATGPDRAPPGGSAPAQPGGGLRIPWEAILSRDDKNQDGKISREEFGGPAQLFDRLDQNHDGFVTREEHEAFQSQVRGQRPAAASTPAPVATPKPAAAVQPAGKGFQLNGERWTYRDGDFAMDGILLKPEGNGPFPAVLISHGMGGSAESFGMQKAREMVKWGLVCIAPNYTHSATAGAGRPGAPPANAGASDENLRRARACLEILAGLPYADGKRFAAYGHSMGGFVTIGLTATSPQLLKAAAITGSGVSPRAGFAAPSVEAADKIRTPFLMMHGSNDTTVRPDQSASLKEVLDRNKVSNERQVFEGEGHPIDQTKRDQVFPKIRAWFVTNGVLPAGVTTR